MALSLNRGRYDGGSMEEDWETRRSRLNHDWLAKVYAGRLGAWRNVLEGRVRDDAFVARFIARDFAEWEQYRIELARLATDFALHMSPRVLIQRPPLDCFDQPTRQWLGDLVDGLWRVRCNVGALTDRSDILVRHADAVYESLKSAISKAAPGPFPAAVQKEARRFFEFQRACSDLSNAISTLPHGIRVV